MHKVINCIALCVVAVVQLSGLFIIGSNAYCNFTSFPYRTVSAYVSPLHAVRNVGECLLIAVHYLLQLVQIISGWGQLRFSVWYLASTCPVNLCLLWPLQGFVLEDATGLSLNGDLDVHSVIAGSLPTTHPSFAPQNYLEFSTVWQAPPLPDEPVDIFIGVLSSANHFAERMGVRKTWMSAVLKSPNRVARFFVALINT